MRCRHVNSKLLVLWYSNREQEEGKDVESYKVVNMLI